MYYLIYGFLYLLSLLPFFILYLISDFIYVLLYYVFGYRKKIVQNNLAIAFPEKAFKEQTRIAKQFYKNLVDTFIEMIKMVSISKHEFEKRCTIDLEPINALVLKGKNIQLQSGHQMNWEYANWIMGNNSPIPFIGIYKVIGNGAINKLFFKIRAKYNTILVSTTDFRTKKDEILKGQYAIALAADQNGNPDQCFWLNFFGKPVPFVTGPAKGAIKKNNAVIFINFVKIKRGYYHFATQVMVENANEYSPEQLTLQYRDLLEKTIRETPDNYLWTHRRWKHEYKNRYSHLWIDTTNPN